MGFFGNLGPNPNGSGNTGVGVIPHTGIGMHKTAPDHSLNPQTFIGFSWGHQNLGSSPRGCGNGLEKILGCEDFGSSSSLVLHPAGCTNPGAQGQNLGNVDKSPRDPKSRQNSSGWKIPPRFQPKPRDRRDCWDFVWVFPFFLGLFLKGKCCWRIPMEF